MKISNLLITGLLASATAVQASFNSIRIDSNFQHYAGSNGDQVVIDNADGRLTYYTNIYKIGFTSISNIFVLDTWIKWEPGKTLGSSYYQDSQLGKCTIHVEPYRYYNSQQNKTGGQMHQIAAWPVTDSERLWELNSAQEFGANNYVGIFSNNTNNNFYYSLGYGTTLYVPCGTEKPFIKYSKGDVINNYYNYYSLDNTIVDVPFSYSSSSSNLDHYVNEWVFEPSYDGSGAKTFDFHTIVVFEMSNQTINTSENAMCYLYSFKIQNRYPQQVLWWTTPTLGTEYSYSVIGVTEL